MSSILQKICIREAVPDDAAALSSLAFKSKASWGYDIDFMKRCRAELTYTADQIASQDHVFFVCEIDDDPVAFYALDVLDRGRAELEALFVKPGYIGQGIGKMLVEHMSGEAAARGVNSVTIQGDPNAEDFYLSIGATAAGYRESASIRGRFLPVFILAIAEGRH